MSDDASETGNAFHRWIAPHIQGVELDQGSLVKEHGVDADELAYLCMMGAKAWAEIATRLSADDGHPLTEYALSSSLDDDTTITGTADVLVPQGKTVLLVDFKTGRVDADHQHQLMGYAYCALTHKIGPSDVVLMTVWVRQGTWDVAKINNQTIADWRNELRRRLKNGRNTFNPGPHCGYCPRAAACPGRRAMVRATIADWGERLNILKWDASSRALLGPEIGEAFGKAKLIEKAIKDFREVLKDDVAANGDLPIGGGRKLTIVTINKREIDVAKARPVLARHLSQEAIDGATSIGAGALDDAIMAASEKGSGARNLRTVKADLDAAGAATVREETQLREGKA